MTGRLFPASLQALDRSGNVVTGFEGVVTVSALVEGRSPRLLISEVAARTTRGVEVCNVSDSLVNVSGWRMNFYDASTWPSPRTTFIIPPGTVCEPRRVFQILAGGSAPGAFPSFFLGINLGWQSNVPDNPIAVALWDEAGTLVDFFSACGGHLFLLDLPSPSPSDIWQGLPLSVNSASSRTYQRVGGMDHNNAADWSTADATLGVLNGNLRTPFLSPAVRSAASPATVQFNQGQWQGMLKLDEPARGVWLHADDRAGVSGDSSKFEVLAGPLLVLDLPPGGHESTAGELGVGRVWIPNPLTTNLQVTLNVDVGGEILVPSSVVIPSGLTNGTFAVTNLDDPVLDGARIVTIKASAPGFAGTSVFVTNFDDEMGSLIVTIPATAREGDNLLVGAGRVSVDVPVGIDYPVNLTTSTTNELNIPAVVYIPRGQTSAVFDVRIVDDPKLDGTQRTIVWADASGSISGSAQMDVADNENPILYLDLYVPVEEGRGTVSNAVRVTLGGVATSNIVVHLVSLDPGRVQVPPTLTVPSGESSVFTYFVIPDDALTNGLATVTVKASAPDFPDASNTTNVRDNDLQRFFVVSIPGAQMSGQPFSVTAYAHTIDGYVPSMYERSVTLRALGHAGPLFVNPSNITFSAGSWSGTVAVTGEGRGTVLTFDDGLNHTGISNPFEVSMISTSGPPLSDIVYDPARRQIVAGVKADGGTNANSVVGIDPASGEIVWRIPLGTEPGRLSLSDDFSVAYVGGNTTGGVSRVDLATRTVTLRFPLGTDASFGPFYVEDMEVMPGHPRTVVISRKVAFGAYNRGLAVYDDSVQRPGVIGPGSFAYGYYVEFYGDSNKLYSASADGIRIGSVGPNGLTTVGSRGGALYATDLEFAGNLLYANSGTVFWPETLRVAGVFPSAGWVCPDPATGRIAFLNGNRLQVFDQNTYSELGTMTLMVNAGNPAGLLRCGANRLAFRTDQNHLAILQTDLIPVPGAADLRIADASSSPQVATVGGTLTYTMLISNAGPFAVKGALLTDQLPESAAFVTASTSRGVCRHTNGIVSCQLGDLDNGDSIAIAITALARRPGEMINIARAIGGALNPANDVIRQTNSAFFGSSLPAVTEISLSAVDLAYDSASNRLWATVGVNNGVVENGLRAIALNAVSDPAPVSLGEPPGRVIVSTNGQYLYVALNNSSLVRRRDLWNAGQTIALSTGSITDMEVVPGSATSLAICNGGGSVAIFDGSTRRPQFAGNCRFIEFGASGARIYGIDAEFGNTGLWRFNVAATGVTLVDMIGGLAVHRPDFRYYTGRIYCSDGVVINPESLQRVATLPANGLVLPDPDSGEVLYLTQNYPAWILAAFNATTLAPAWAFTIPGVSNAVGSLIPCGPGRVAFRADPDQVFILNTAQMPRVLEADQEFYFTPPSSAGPVGSPFTIVGVVRNRGPGPTTGVTIINTFSPGTVLLSHSTAHGTCTNEDGTLACRLEDLPPGGAASIVLTIAKTNAGTLLVTGTASSNQLDPIPTNNIGTFTAPVDLPPSADVGVWDSFVFATDGRLAYSIVVSNAGPDVAENVSVVDVYPTGGAMVSLSASQGVVATNSGNISANLGSIPPRTAAIVSLVIDPPISATLVNRAEISLTTPDPAPSNNDSVSVITPGGASLVTKIPLLAEDLAYDAVHRQLYLSVPPNGGALSNTVVAVDPDTGEFKRTLHFAEPISKLAVTDDGQYLYASLASTGAVLRIDTATGNTEARILLPDNPRGTRVAFDLATLPGMPRSIAVSSRWIGIGFPGIEIYDDTTIRTNFVWIDSGVNYFFLGVPSLPGRLCAHGHGGFHLLSLDALGVSMTEPGIGGLPASDFALEQGRAYFDTGHVLNLENKSLVGAFRFGPGFVAPDVAADRVYFLPQKGSPTFYSTITLRAFHPVSFADLWSFSFPTPIGVERGLIKLRSGEFALRTDGSRARVLVIRTRPLDTPSTDIRLEASASPSPVTVGGAVTYGVSVRNDGPWNATNVVVTSALASGSSFVSATASQGSCTATNGIVTCSLGALTNTGSATLSVVVTAGTTGLHSNLISVVHGIPDLNPNNNSLVVVTPVNPAPTVSIADTTMLEGSTVTPITFTLALSAASTRPITVNYATANGSAVAGLDYDTAAGLVTFNPGTVTRTITLTPGIRGNLSITSNRFFFINLSNPTNVVLGRNQAKGFIVDDDFYAVSVQSVSVMEGNSGQSDATFTFSLQPISTNPVTVDYSTFDATALAGTDYLARRGTILFQPGSSQRTVTVPVVADVCHEPDKSFFLYVTTPSNAQLAVNEVTGRILDDDPIPALQILGINRTPGGWTIQFRSACGRSYRLQRSAALGSAPWQTVSPTIEGDGNIVAFEDTFILPGEQAFYRIELLP